MKKIIFTREQRIVNALIVNSNMIEDLGILHGKMGIVLYFYIISRVRSNDIFSNIAGDLLDSVIESLHDGLPINFENGITGIAWAVEYLIQNKYVDAESDDVLEEIDIRINNELTHNMDKVISLVISIGYYYISRLHYRVSDKENMKVLDLKYHTTLLVDELDKQVDKGESHPQLYHLLTELLKLNISNHKINKLLKITNIDNTKYLFPFVPKLSKEQTVEQLNQKDVKSRHAGFSLENIPEDEKYGLKHGLVGIGLQAILI